MGKVVVVHTEVTVAHIVRHKIVCICKLKDELHVSSPAVVHGTYKVQKFILHSRVADPYSFHPDPIRIQHLRMNTNPDPIRIQGFNDQKLEKNYS